MSKGIVKRLNSRAAILDVPKKNGEVVEVIVFNQEMFEGVGSHITHPEIFIGNEVDITISKTLTDKYQLYNAELNNKQKYEGLSGKKTRLQNNAYAEHTVVTAAINRVEKHYITDMEIDHIENLLNYLSKIEKMDEFADSKVAIALLVRFFEVIVEERTIGSHALSEKLGQIVRKETIMKYLMLAEAFISLYSKTANGKEYQDDLALVSTQVKNLSNNILESEHRFFATIVDEEYYGVEVSFYETTVNLRYGDIVLVEIIHSKNEKIRGEVVAVINECKSPFKGIINELEDDSELDGIQFPCFIDNKRFMQLPEKAKNYYVKKSWNGKDYIYMLTAEDETLPNMYWREFYIIKANFFNTDFVSKSFKFFNKFASKRSELVNENINLIFKDKSTTVGIRHKNILYSYSINNDELIQLTTEDILITADELKESMKIVQEILEIKRVKTK